MRLTILALLAMLTTGCLTQGPVYMSNLSPQELHSEELGALWSSLDEYNRFLLGAGIFDEGTKMGSPPGYLFHGTSVGEGRRRVIRELFRRKIIRVMESCIRRERTPNMNSAELRACLGEHLY